MRRLVGSPDLDRVCDIVPFGEHDPPLERNRGAATVAEFHLDDQIRLAEGLLDIARRDVEMIVGVAGDPVVNEWRVRRSRALDIEHRGQPVINGVHRLDAVLSLMAAFRDDHGERLSNIDDLVARQDRHLRFLVARVGIARDQRTQQRRKLARGKDRDDASRRRSVRHIEGSNPSMGHIAAEKGDVQHARSPEIVDIATASAEKARILLPPQRGADEAIGLFCRRAHPFSPPESRRATANVASTMNW